MSKSSFIRDAARSFERRDKEEQDAHDGLCESCMAFGTHPQGFTHSAAPGPDKGSFALSEIRGILEPGDRGGSRIVSLPISRYARPPQFAKGLKACDLNHRSRMVSGLSSIDLDINIVTHPKNTSTIRPIIQARNSTSNTKMIRDAEMSWMEVKHCAKDCFVYTTSFDLKYGETKKMIFFARPFVRDYEIVSWIKDFKFNTWQRLPYACDAWASDITQRGFTANVSGSKSLERLAVTWIIYYKGKPKVNSGTFGTQDIADRLGKAPRNCGRVTFRGDAFQKPPTVLVALSQFDHAGARDLRIGVYVANVDRNGFDWQLDTWGDVSDDVLSSAEASFIALGYS